MNTSSVLKTTEGSPVGGVAEKKQGAGSWLSPDLRKGSLEGSILHSRPHSPPPSVDAMKMDSVGKGLQMAVKNKPSGALSVHSLPAQSAPDWGRGSESEECSPLPPGHCGHVL